MAEKIIKNKLSSKALVAILGLLIVCLSLYLFGLPFYPDLRYKLFPPQPQAAGQETGEQSVALIAQSSAPAVASSSLTAGQKEEGTRGNYLIISKIGVDIPIVDSDNSAWALNRGAWRLPETSTPDKGSNTAIAGHRFKYLPPNNLTFYLLDKLVAGDTMQIIWEGKVYNYSVTESKIVAPTEVSVLSPTARSIITLITCDPVFTQKNRLIVIGELI